MDETNLPPLMAEAVIAGFPSPAEQHVETPLDLNAYLIDKPAATFFVRVEGNSMLNAGILPGDILAVDRSLKPSDGSIVIACVDNEFTVKYLRQRDGMVFLEAANPDFDPIKFKPGMELRIFGVVKGVVRKLK